MGQGKWISALSATATLLALFQLPSISSARAATAPAAVCASGTCTITITDATTFYDWVVPAGLSSVTFDARGGQGGTGSSNSTMGGLGGRVTGSLSLTAGETITFYVGAVGGNGSTSRSLSGGRNSGGAGGSSSRSGGAGGAHSEIVKSGTTVVIAAGGGGSGGWAGGAGGGGGSATYSAAGIANGVNGSAGQAGAGTAGTTTGGSGGSIGGGGSLGSAGSSLSGGAGGAGTAGGGGGGGGGYFGGGGGGGDNDSSGSDGGGGGGGSNFYRTSVVSSVTGFAASQSGAGRITISYPSTAVVSLSAGTSLTNSTSLNYSLTFSENITGLSSSDFSLTGTGASSCTIGTITGSGSSYSIPLTGCSEGNVVLTLTANSVSGTVTGPPSNFDAANVRIDRTAPTISSIAVNTGSYAPGNAVNLVTTFSESITVTGTPRIPITIGSTTRYASYVSLSDSRTATFRYTVQVDVNDIDTDGIAVVSPLELNAGSITDLATNLISNLSFTTPITTSVFVTQKASAPTINSIDPGNASLSVAFTAGPSGGAAITNYKYSLNGGAFTSVGGTTSPFTISSLVNGTTYAVRILAVTSAGDGDSSTAVTATPSAVVVGGGSNISRVYGSQSSSSAFTASGGTSPYAFSLSGGSVGISIDASTGVVTTSATLAVGTYTPSVVATDSNATPRSGSRSISITISQATPTISISLPGAATNAAVGAAVTITATLSVNGSVNFRLGGTTISGCGSISSSALSATCSWTPTSTGSAVLTAVLTPTDSTNYASANTTDLNISVVNGSTSVLLTIAGNVTQVSKGRTIVITASIDQIGRVTFFSDGIRIPNCINLVASGSSVNCNWKPAIQKQVNLTARLTPSNSIYNASTGSLNVQVVRRSGTR